MVASNKTPGGGQLLVPPGCPQNPEGKYDLIGGARREFLLGKMNKALEIFQKNGEVEELFRSIQTLIVKGLAVADLDHVVASDKSGNLSIDCREIISGEDEPRIEITVVDHDRRYLLEVAKDQISPTNNFPICSCPLVGRGEQPGCNPETCQALIKARHKTAKKTNPPSAA